MLECTLCHASLVDDAAFCPQCGMQVGGAEECTDYVYEAFISYRHLAHDTEVATSIQRQVEGFKIPKELRQNSGSSAASGIPKTRTETRLGKLFRDEDELPTSSSLSSQIEDALKHSRYLVVICTPQTRESRWVAREVELFSSYHGRDRVLVALAEAEPPDSFPDLLLGRKVAGPDGTVRVEATEPLAADFRDKGKYKQESLRIVAALLGCGFDDLRQRQRARRNAAIAKIGAGVAAVSLAFAGFSGYQQMQIVKNQRALQISQSRFLAQEVDDLLEQGKRMQAVQVALTALPQSSTSDDRPYVPEAQNALEQALQTYRTSDGWYPLYSHTEQADIRDVKVNRDEGLYAVLDQTNTVHVYRTATGEQTAELQLDEIAAEMPDVADGSPKYYTWKIELCGKSLIAYQNMGASALCFDADDGTLLWNCAIDIPEDLKSEETHASIIACTASNDATLVALVHSSQIPTANFEPRYLNGAVVFDAQTGKVIDDQSIEVEVDAHTTLSKAAFDDSGRYLAATYNSTVTVFDLEEDATATTGIAYGDCEDITWSGQTLLIASSDWFAGADEGDGMSWPCSVQAFDASLEQRWSAESTLSMISRKKSLYSETVEFCSSDLDGDGSNKRTLAFAGCKLMAIDVDTGEIETLNTFADPICCAITGGEAESRGVYVCTNQGTLTFSLLSDLAWGESNTDGTIEPVSQGWFVSPIGGSDYDLGFLVSTPDDRTDQRTTTVRAMRSSLNARESFNLRALSTSNLNSDRTLLASRCANGDYSSIPEEPALYVFDATSFEVVATITASQMSQAGFENAWQAAFSLDDTNTLLVFGTTKENEGLIAAFDARTGNLLTSRTFENALSETSWLVCAGTGQIVTFESNYPEESIVLLDPTTLDEQVRIASPSVDIFQISGESLDASCANAGIWCNGDVFSYGISEEGNATMVDCATGELVESDFTSYRFEGESIVFHGSGSEGFAVGAGASQLACFDLPSGTARWSVEVAQGTPTFFSISPDGETVIMQASGSLISLDAATGTIKGTSTTPFGTMMGCSYSADGSMLYARCQMPDDAFGRCTLHAIRLDDPTLTPISSIDYGVTISSDGDEVLVDNGSSSPSSTWVLPYLGLDELIAQGSDLTAGFELTDQERRALMLE